MNAFRCACIAAVGLLLCTSIAEAQRYRRSCRVDMTAANQNANQVTVYFERFSASAASNAYIPNTLRLRAYRRAVSCLGAVWDRRHGYGVPPECTAANGISGFDIGSLNQVIRREACPTWSWRGTTRVIVRARISGNKGCGGRRTRRSAIVTLGSGYAISCP